MEGVSTQEIAQKIKDNKNEIVTLNAKIAQADGEERKQLILQRNMAIEHQGYLKKLMKQAQSQNDKKIA